MEVWTRGSKAVGAAAIWVALTGCSPAFNWRETAPEGAGLVASFPCRPDRHLRRLDLGGSPVQMEMLVCDAGGATYAVSFFDAADAQKVEAGLMRLRSAMLANIGAGAPRQRPMALAGARFGASAVRIGADGRRPDGVAVRLEAVFFAKDLRVYQAAVLGPALPDDAIEPFFEGLKLPS